MVYNFNYKFIKTLKIIKKQKFFLLKTEIFSTSGCKEALKTST
jgi:hypothetical protein